MAILIVDDEQDTRGLLRVILRAAGHQEILEAGTAGEALRWLGLLNGPGTTGQQVDLVLMDIGMPGVDGVEATRRIKASEHLRDVPVIMVTGRTEPESLKAAFEAGAADYIEKPFNRVELVARVQSALALKLELDRRRAHEEQLARSAAEQESAIRRLEALAIQDPLTGIGNRRAFDAALAREWRRAARLKASLGLIMMDVDQFKAYNDQYGHQRGDECLKRIAAVARASMRRSGDVIARYGGEELAALLPNTDLEGAANLAEVIRAGVEALAIPHGGSSVARGVTISLGAAAMVPESGVGLADLVALADQALYLAKQQGRNCVRSLQPSRE